MGRSDSGRGVAEKRLDAITTQWSLLRLAHEGSVTSVGSARNALVMRYVGAIRRYIGAMLKNDQDADDLAQDVVVRLLSGDFAEADPARGRFRDLLKVAVRNMVRTQCSRKSRRSSVDMDLDQVSVAELPNSSLDQQWIATWRQSVLDHAWSALEAFQHKLAGTVSYTVLRLRVDHPEDDSDALAVRLSDATHRSFRPDAVRQQLRRARLRFAQLVVEEVARSMDDPTPARVEEELLAVGLMEYIRDFLPADWRTRGELRASP